MKNGRIAAIVAGMATVVALGGCAAAGDSEGGTGTVNWWTWDPNQADAYSQCIPAFEEANPDIKVNVQQYNVGDYFTKLTTGFVAGDAPDAFQNSVTFLQAYASQNQLMPLDDYIKDSGYDLGNFAAGVDLWQYTDGNQYGLPLDWAAAALYYNEDLVAEAGLTDDDLQNLTYDPEDGGTFYQVVRHLTVDANGVRGDEPGFDKANVATYGIGTFEGDQSFGDSTWGPLVASTGLTIGDKANWPTEFNYGDPRFVETMNFVRQLSDDGFAPQMGQFTTGGSEQIGSKSVAIVSGGSWEATTYAKLPGLNIGIAPVVKSPDGTRGLISNMNGNVMWAGTKNADATWAWMSFMGSEECQTTAATYNGSFFPSISGSMDALVAQAADDGVDLSAFGAYQADGNLFPYPAYNNGTEMDSTIRPMFEAFFTGQTNDETFADMQALTKEIIGSE